MTDVEVIWRNKTDDEVFAASERLDEYSEEARRTILLEAERRGLNVAPIIDAVASMRRAPEDSGFVPYCDYCGTRILIGGKREGDLRFCNEECRAGGILLAVSRRVPDFTVNEQLWKLHQGRCPRCGGPGPVDVHSSHRVWSAIVLTSWSNRPHISCSRCGMAVKLKDSLVSLVFGWWGFPWGPIMTVVQVFRNLSGMLRERDDARPSAQLEKLVRLRLAGEILAAPSDTPLPPTSGSPGGR